MRGRPFKKTKTKEKQILRPHEILRRTRYEFYYNKEKGNTSICDNSRFKALAGIRCICELLNVLDSLRAIGRRVPVTRQKRRRSRERGGRWAPRANHLDPPRPLLREHERLGERPRVGGKQTMQLPAEGPSTCQPRRPLGCK